MGTGNTPSSKDIKQAEQRRISQIGDFKARIGGLLDLPSGATVRVHNPGGMQAFMDSKAIPNSLMPIIQKALKSGQPMTAAEVVSEDGNLDPALLEDMMKLMDGIILKTVVEPRVHKALTEADLEKWNADPAHADDQLDDIEELRSALDEIDPKLYVDEFPLDDKQFIFQWVAGGTRDLEEFLQEQRENVGAVSAITGNKSSTK